MAKMIDQHFRIVFDKTQCAQYMIHGKLKRVVGAGGGGSYEY